MKKQTEFKTLTTQNINWLKNASENGGAQQIVINSRPDKNLVVCSITKEGDKEARKWADIEPHQLKQLLKKDSGIYEIICSYPFKIYFDIDGKDKPANYYDTITKKINELFTDADIAISGSETALKKSYHFILNNYVINNFEEHEKLKRVVKYLNKTVDDGFDTVVYKKNQLMKSINQAKPATKEQPFKRIQKLIINDNIEKHIITAFFNENTKTINDIIFNDEGAPTKEQKEIKTKTPTETQPEQQQTQAPPTQQNNQLIYKLLDILNQSRADNIETFYNLGCLIKSLDIHFDIWFNLSKTSKHFKPNETYNYLLKKWDTITTKRYSINTLYYWARTDNIELFNKIMIDENINSREAQRDDLITINDRYLLDNVKKLNDDTILSSNVKLFFETSKYKSLNIKSPYDTGKTQFIKEIIRTYNQRRILWVSYRKTLTHDITGNFEKEFNFKSYLNGEFYANRLIIQIESLKKIDNNMGDEMPKYDLIIIDEVESILNQFNSKETFKGNQRDTYNYLDAVLKNSIMNGGKIITLDGDTSERTYTFIETYGKPLNIVNTINFNTKKIKIVNDRTVFNNALFLALLEHKKIIMPVMSEKEAVFYETEIKQRHPNLKVMKYTGKTGDDDKAELKQITKIWAKLDVIIYTPTIEAGVSFDVERFDIIFGIIADGVASQRSYFQMMARVRKIKDNNIYLLNMNNCKINNCNLWKYEDYKQALIEIKDINFKMTFEERDNKMVKIYNDPYDSLYIFNKLEELNKNKFQFLTIFKKIALMKGFEFEIIEKKDNAEKCTLKPDANIINEIILKTDDINFYEYELLLKKQKKDHATEDEKYKIGKFCTKEKLGVDILDIDILNIYNKKGYINNYLGLLSTDNLRCNKDINDLAPERVKINIIKQFLKNIGFVSLSSTKKLNGGALEKILLKMVKRKDDIFNNKIQNKVLFKTVNKKLDSFKGILGYINTILKNYSLKLDSSRDRAGTKEKITFYELEHLHGIQDIIKFNIMNGSIVYDIDEIIISTGGEIKDTKFEMWGHLKNNKTKISNEKQINIIDTSSLDIGIEIN